MASILNEILMCTELQTNAEAFTTNPNCQVCTCRMTSQALYFTILKYKLLVLFDPSYVNRFRELL